MSVNLTAEMKNALDAALDDGCPVICSSVESDGYPTMSFYGSAHVHDLETIGIWVRDPEAGFLKRIKLHNKVTLLYRNSKQKQIWLFQGQAHIAESDEDQSRIYLESHPGEQERDPDRLGKAVRVRVDRVTSYGKVLMER
ncbi:MAG TPA: hypothetical protein EYQ00_11685 [Dehalococcoidia bacterium]|nr:hypothetical protein [Dehalococcoidia bacterium]